jgi:hypothetical protein
VNSVLVFTGRSAIDGADFRWQLLRVPEVSKVLKEAQLTIDECLSDSKDLVSFIQQDNNEYLAGGLWRELCAQLVQVGLYRRYQKLYTKPRFIIGDASPISAAPVCLGLMSIQELILSFMTELVKKQEEEQSKDFLVGQKLETSKVYEYKNNEFSVLSEGKGTIALLDVIMKDYLLDQVITLGAATGLGASENLAELGVVESVVMDPLLSWMLPYLKTA